MDSNNNNNNNKLCINDFKFKHPFTAIISGMTGSGKTEHAKLILHNWKNLLLIPEKLNATAIAKPLNVLWCYSEEESLKAFKNVYFEDVNLQFNKGVPLVRQIKELEISLLIIDDLMDEINQDIRDLFIKKSHHLQCSVILIVHNITNSTNKHMITLSRNAHYVTFTAGKRNAHQLKYLLQQILPKKAKIIADALELFSKHGYLLVDLHPQSTDECMLRTRFFREELPSNLASKHSFCPIYCSIKK